MNRKLSPCIYAANKSFFSSQVRCISVTVKQETFIKQSFVPTTAGNKKVNRSKLIPESSSRESLKRLNRQYMSLDLGGTVARVENVNEVEQLSHFVAQYLFQKGIVLGSMGKTRDAAVNLLQAFGSRVKLDVDPKQRLFALELVARYYLEGDELRLALEWQDSAIHFAQRTNQIGYKLFEMRSDILSRMGKHGEAVDDFHRVLKLKESAGTVDNATKQRMAWLNYLHCRSKKRYNQALDHLEEVISQCTAYRPDLIELKLNVLRSMRRSDEDSD